jgi:hypothetical protein
VVEEAVMEAVVERDPRKPGREACMDKRRARETAAAETHAAAHASDMHSATPAAGMHAATHPAAVHAAAHTATVHATAHAATVAAATTTAATPSECRWHKRKRRRERTRNEASKDPAGHPNSSSVIEWPRQMPPHEDNDREMTQRFQLTNATVSDAEVRFVQKVFSRFHIARGRRRSGANSSAVSGSWGLLWINCRNRRRAGPLIPIDIAAG